MKIIRRPPEEGITRITVAGYKSIEQEQSVEIRPLTILAGANSSGKSSLMQPLLLLKQTLEAAYDPGALLLNGPNVKFTSFDQLLSNIGKGKRASSFRVGIEAITMETEQGEGQDGEYIEWETPSKDAIEISFGRHSQSGFDVQQMTYHNYKENKQVTLRSNMSEAEIASAFLDYFDEEELKNELRGKANDQAKSSISARLAVVRERCYLVVQGSSGQVWLLHTPFFAGIPPASATFSPHLKEIIHLPGLRGNPERNYPVTAIGKAFPGTFENYTASIIVRWQQERKAEKISHLSSDLERLGLTWKVAAKHINDTQVELQVGRLTHAGQKKSSNLVNITDVGFGISQTLPALVALHTAEKGQLVYLEQPEIHLHPRAQTAMAGVLADAAKRGVRVVAETHSSLLLLGIQTLIAEGKLSPDLVKLHWFARDENGATSIRSADLDESGAFGDWPEDFDDVTLDAQSRYLDAAESRQQRIH